MTQDEYLQEWQDDAKTGSDIATLLEDARNIPYLHAKWWKYYTRERLTFRAAVLEHKRLTRLRWEWYQGKLSPEDAKTVDWGPTRPLKILSGNMPMYLDGDPVLQQIEKRKIAAEEKMKFLEDVIKSINFRGNLLRTILDYERFKQGV